MIAAVAGIKKQYSLVNRIFTNLIFSVALAALLVFAAVSKALGQVDSAATDPLINCQHYRAKKSDIPVYAKPDPTSGVLAKLKLGEKVCYIGEQAEYAVIDWRHQQAINAIDPAEKDQPQQVAKPQATPTKSSELAYARLVDLWPPRDDPSDSARENFVERLAQHYYYLREGGVPDNAFRSLFGLEPFEPACTAGKICQEISQCPEGKNCQENTP